MSKITVDNTSITVMKFNESDFISLTDIARRKSSEPNVVIGNWIRNRNTIEYLGVWETLYNPKFKPLEFEGFKKEAGLNAFTLSPLKWVTSTNASGIVVKSGRYGGTYAHRDIAFKFASWISVKFELYLYKEFQRLKEEEQKQLGWSAKRELARLNYRIHTDAVKQNLIPPELDRQKASIVYANEADVLNVAMFGMTALEWREANPDKKGNIRDYAGVNELICLSNLESLNAVFIGDGMPQGERLLKLNRVAISQMNVLAEVTERRIFLPEAPEKKK
ncbi:MAG: KilA-N domain protein [Lentisphaerae bacterium ADurb.Bin242]|nr:MAG: KilA-N domain protein [Lentisphaerae bacterium ADurb.Bin242]